MILSNMGLVYAIASRLKFLAESAFTYKDMVQVGRNGLVYAVDRYKPEIARFSTYAYPMIKFHILQGSDDTDLIRIGSYRKAQIRKMQQEKRTLEQELGRESTMAELANYMNVTVSQIKQWNYLETLTNPLSTEEKIGKFQTKAADLLVDGSMPDPMDMAKYEMTVKHIDYVLKGLTKEQQCVLMLFEGIEDGKPKKFKEIAEKLEISTGRARKLYVTTVKELAAKLSFVPSDLAPPIPAGDMLADQQAQMRGLARISD
mmetsp:Transcript_14135/g.26368  ORF Transcript_14135/g.26368 Transcript_14135/m.26368 type:complete len:259 (+) Transcript_14135:3-779(+)